MAYDVKVKIELLKPSNKAAWGYPLILVVGATKDYTEYKSLVEIADDYASTTDAYKAAALMFSQDNPPEKIAIMSVESTSNLAKDLVGKDFRQIMLISETAEDVKAVAQYANATEDKMFFATAKVENDAYKTAITATEAGERVVLFVHSDPLAVAALVGESAGRTVGSFTYKNLVLNGITPMPLLDTEIDAIHTAKAITFVTKAGDNVTSEGFTTKTSDTPEYIDVVDTKDYLIKQLEYQTQKLLNTAPKIPYDNVGIAMLESVAVNVLKDGYNKGMIAVKEDGTPDYTVNYMLREETDASDRVVRKYVGGRFKFTLAGAVHEVEINGEIEI